MRWTLVIALLASTARADDYDLDSKSWNGLSALVGEAALAGCAVSAPGLLDWSVVGPHDVLWFVYPEVSVEPGRLKRFLAQGGRALLADDFGAASEALSALSIERARAPLSPEVPRYRNNPHLPIAHHMLATELGRATNEIVANHPARFQSQVLPFTYGFEDGAALVIEGKVGTGSFVALSDPSVLINNMQEIEGNHAFAQALVHGLCQPGDRILLYSHGFTTRGEPPETGSPFSRFNSMLTSMNGALHDDVAGGRVLAVAAVILALASLFAFGSSFPGRGAVDQHWMRLGKLLDREEPAFLPQGLPWDYALPATVVRDEAVERLTAALSVPVERMGPSELGRRVEVHLGVEAGRRAAELWRELHRLGWRAGERPVEAISGRRFRHMHELATALFDELAMRQNQGR